MVQQRAQIEDRVRELQIDLKTLESERQTLRGQLVPATAEMEAAEELMRTTKTTHRTELEQLNKEVGHPWSSGYGVSLAFARSEFDSQSRPSLFFSFFPLFLPLKGRSLFMITFPVSRRRLMHAFFTLCDQ